MSSFTTFLQLLGGVSFLSLSYRFYYFLHLYLRPSSLPKYHHGRPGSTWALVTGASDGIGYGFATALLAQGFNIVIHGRNPEKLAAARDRLSKEFPGPQIRVAVADAGDYDADIDGIVKTCAALPGKLTILINNVGGIPDNAAYNQLDNIEGASVDAVVNVNLRFPTQLTRALLPLLKKNGPSLIMNVGSQAGLRGIAYLAVYSGSKAFNMIFSEAMSAETRADGADVEVLGIKVGNVTSNSNKMPMAGVTCTSAVMAQASLDRVGCGYTNVWGWWRHNALNWAMELLPQQLAMDETSKIMKQRKLVHEKETKRQ